MEDSNPLTNEVRTTEQLLAVVIAELRGIGSALARQDERIEALSRSKNRLEVAEWADGSSEELKSSYATNLRPCASTSSFSSSISTELRTGFFLQEALTRYNLNAIPAWSPFYGTHLMHGEGPETAEDAIRNTEWTSVVGECWRIPHDNRVNFCFRAGMSDSQCIVRVRNFVSHFHRSAPGAPKGEFFNIWDWFDTGLSAYWYPGKSTSTIPLRFPISLAGNKSEADYSYPLSTMIAPWRRVINLQGLTTLSISGDSVNPEDLTNNDLCPFLSETRESVFQEAMDDVLWRALNCHLRCVRASETEHAALGTKGWILFHTTFYEIFKCEEEKSNLTELWPYGELHSDQFRTGRPRRIRESALTIIAIPSVELPGPKARSIYWTMLCMRPHQFPHLSYSESREDLSRRRTHEMIDEMSDLIQGSLSTVIHRWEQIAYYLEGLLAEKNGLLNPEYHDSLLIDDAKFTRSKKYFWAIEFLIEAEASVSDNINQTKRFIELMNSNPPTGEVARRIFLMRLEKHNTAIQKLENLKRGFVKKQEEAKALRDGLFSASAVMESRASTQLGENIKILTYISIFFLPITVCTSFWSMSDSLFSLSSLAIVTPLVAFGTYAIVLNLDRIIQIFAPLGPDTTPSKSSFQYFAETQYRRMQRDRSSIWRNRGDAFEEYNLPTKSGGRPSRLRVLQFILRSAILRIWHALISFVLFAPRTMTNWRRGRQQRVDDELRPVSLANLGDACVHVQVDVNVEDVEASTAGEKL